jgi:hypothetical protein
MARYTEALRAIAAYDTRSALVVCDELGVLGLPAVGLDEPGLMKTADHIERMLPLPGSLGTPAAEPVHSLTSI